MIENTKKRYNSLNEINFVPLSSDYIQLLEKFKTYQTELRKFLIEDALNNQGIFISKTYLLFDKENFNQHKQDISKLMLLGYVTITADSINLDSSLKEMFREKGVNYKSLPAMKIGRLCVDKRFERSGLGRMLIAFCIKQACALNNEYACRFITLDAKRHNEIEKDSLHFYTKMGFEVLLHRNKSKIDLIKQTSGLAPMYLDLYHIIKNSEQETEAKV